MKFILHLLLSFFLIFTVSFSEVKINTPTILKINTLDSQVKQIKDFKHNFLGLKSIGMLNMKEVVFPIQMKIVTLRCRL